MFPVGSQLARRIRRAPLALVAGLCLVASGGAAAQDNGFYSAHFEPSPSQGLNLLDLGSSRVLGHVEASAGVFFQYPDDPLQLVTDDRSQEVVSRLVERQLEADLWLSLGFANDVELGVVLPLVLNQAGQDLSFRAGRGLSADHVAIAGYRERWPIDPSDPFHAKVCRLCSAGCTCEVGSSRQPDPNEAQIRAENRRSVFRVLELQDPDGTVKQCKLPYAAP